MISFDLFPYKNVTLTGRHDMGNFLGAMPASQKAGIDYIQRAFPGRFQDYAGTSDVSIPKFIQENPGYKCDLVYIDGCHHKEPTFIDITNFRKLATKDTVVLLDDLEFPGVREAIEEAIAKGLLEPFVECILGEVLIDQRFGMGFQLSNSNPKKFCQTRFKF